MNEISENNPHEIFIKTLKISNYKGFKACEKEDLSDAFSVEFCTPNGTMGSGLTILLGDNNCGKTTILDAVNLATIRVNDKQPQLAPRAKEAVYNDEGKGIAIRFRMTTDAVQEIRMTACNVPHSIILTKRPEDYARSLSQRPPKATILSPEYKDYREKFGFFNDRIFKIHKEHREKIIVRDFIVHDPTGSFNNFINRQDFEQGWSSSTVHYDIEKSANLLQKTKIDPVYEEIFHMPKPDPLYASYSRVSFQNDDRLKTELEKEYDTLGNGTLVFASMEQRIEWCKKKGTDGSTYYEKNIFLIDEPEEALHPKAITKLVKFLCDIGKTCQIILTTHSLQIVEDVLSLLRENNQKEPEKHFRILTKENGKISLTDMSECFLRYISASEVNYVAFHRITAGYFNELYGCLNAELASRAGKEYLQQEAMDDFFEKKGYKKDKKTEGRKTPETVFTYLRNAICHPENKERSYQEKDLTENTKKLLEIVKELKEESKNGEKAH